MPADLWIHSLTYGLILSAVMTVFILASIFYNPEIWLHDFPPDIQEKYGPASEKSLRERRIFTIPFMLAFIGIIAAALITLPAAIGHQPNFLELFVTVFIVFMTFNLVDLLFIDWLFGIVLRPSSLVLPGTEGLAGYSDYAFHFRGFLKGTAGGLIASAVLAAIAAMLFAIL
jgi:hypothetical protein